MSLGRVDTHCHVVPPVWRKYCNELGHAKPDGMPAIPAWDAEAHIELMDKLGVSRSVLSITSPGTHLKYGDDKLAAQITRETNIEISEICAKYPDRFSFFASLPAPAVDESIAEIDYALDKLGASGFALMTNSHGVYLGDSSLDPIFAKLNERKAVVFMHPTQCHALHDPTGQKPLNKYPSPMLEFFFDTTRAVTNLLVSGTVNRYTDITFIVSHCGAALPPMVERFTNFASAILSQDGALNSDNVKQLFKSRFYFDLAGFPFPDLIHGYLRVSDETRLLYGSDFPYTPAKAVERLGEVMDKGLKELFDKIKVKAIYSGNAQELLKLGEANGSARL